MRVWELAEELQVLSTDILELIRPHDAYVTSHLATVPRHALDAIRADPPAPKWQWHEYDDWHRPPPGHDPSKVGTLRARPSWPKLRRRRGPKPISFEPPYEEDARGNGNDPTDELRYEPIWTTRDITRYYGVTAATVRQWVKRGHLAPCGKEGPSHIFRREDIFDAVAGIHSRSKPTSQPDPDRKRPSGLPTSALIRLAAVTPGSLVTTNEAAVILGLAPSTIRAWVRRGHLRPTTPPADTPKQRQSYFRLADVQRAASRTNQVRGRRRKPQPH